MYVFKVIFILFAIIFPVGALAYLAEYIKSKYQKSTDKSKFFNPLRYKSIIIVLVLSVFSILVVNLTLKEPVFNDPYKMIKYGEKRKIPAIVKAGYEELLQNDFKNIDLHLKFIDAHFNQAEQTKKNNEFIQRNDNDIFNLYNYQKLSKDDTLKNIGAYGHAYCLYKINKYSKAIYELKQANVGDFRNKNYVIAKSYSGLKNLERAEDYFLKEIKFKNGNKELSVNSLCKIYLKQKKIDKILLFNLSPELKDYISDYDLKDVYAIEFNFPKFVQKYFFLVYKRIDLVGLIAALLICFTWLYYIKRIDIYEQEKWRNILIILLMGMLFSSFANFTTSLSEFYFDFKLKGKVINDFLYATINNGMIEEIFKILPLVFLLLFTKIINEPYDYILYASVSALGFAFIENLVYFESGSLHILHGRALISVVGHMVNSSIIAYGLVLAKYKRKRSPIIAFVLFYILASLTHGLYNFLLFYNLQFIFVIYYLFLIRIWITFINNALNNTSVFDYRIKLDSDKLQYYLVTSLTSILIFEYFTIGLIYGNIVANNTFIETSAMGSILILFLSSRLSNYDLVRNHWSIIDYRINPFLFKTYPLNFVGYKIRIDSYYQSGFLSEVIKEPLTGVITDRIIVHNESIWSYKTRKTEKNWFLVKLDEPIKLSKGNKKYILLKFRSKQPKLQTEKDLLAQLLVIKNMKMLENSNISRENLRRLGGVIVNLIAID